MAAGEAADYTAVAVAMVAAAAMAAAAVMAEAAAMAAAAVMAEAVELTTLLDPQTIVTTIDRTPALAHKSDKASKISHAIKTQTSARE